MWRVVPYSVSYTAHWKKLQRAPGEIRALVWALMFVHVASLAATEETSNNACGLKEC